MACFNNQYSFSLNKSITPNSTPNGMGGCRQTLGSNPSPSAQANICVIDEKSLLDKIFSKLTHSLSCAIKTLDSH